MRTDGQKEGDVLHLIATQIQERFEIHEIRSPFLAFRGQRNFSNCMKNMKLVLRGVEKVVKLGTHSNRSRTRNGTRRRRRRNLFVCSVAIAGYWDF